MAAQRATPVSRPGRKLVVQIGEAFGEKNAPLFVEQLDIAAASQSIVTDDQIFYLH